MKDTVFVLVPGSFSTTVFYEKITPVLQSKGYEVKEVPLLSANDGTRQPPATMEEDAAHIRKAVEPILKSGKNVVLGVHSYSGVPGTEAVKGLAPPASGAADNSDSGHVVGLVYITAMMLKPGESCRTTMAHRMPEEVFNAPLDIYLPWNPEFSPGVFNDLLQQEGGQAEMERYATHMLNHSSVSYSGKATYEAWRDVPNVTYILATADLIVPTEVQHTMVDSANEKSDGKVKKVTVEGAGHAPNVTRPEIVIEELIKAAA